MLSIVAAALFSALSAHALPCVQFDTSFNLYAFGGTSDVNLGQSSSWGSPTAQTLTTTGRPPWTGNTTQCLLSQYNNALYVLGGDASDLTKIYIYDFGGSSWSTQTTSSPPPNLGSRSASVLDHDTNVIFTLPTGSGASLYQLDLGNVKASASGSAIGWEAVEAPSFSMDGYTPTAAEASNHISYFGVPATAAGSADMFVVHFSYFQPDVVAYPTLNGGATFPDTAGQAISIPNSQNNAPDQMVYIPNDFSSTYVVTHYTDPGNYSITSSAPFAANLINSTQILPAPSSNDVNAAYAASTDSLVQIDSAGNIYYMTSAVGSDYTVNSAATWTKMSYTLAGTGGTVVAGSGSSSNSSASASGSSSSMSASGTSMSGSSSASMTTSTSASASGSAGASATSGSAATSASASAKSGAEVRAMMGKGGLVGLAVGLVAVGVGMVL